MKNKFKVGDIVRGIDTWFAITNYRMRKGEIVEIFDCGYRIEVLDHEYKSHNGTMLIAVDSINGNVDKHFELVKPAKPETIVIYRKEDRVYALDKQTGKTCFAKCHPDDEFDFYKGAEIALNRLLGKEPVKEEPKETYYNGKIICLGEIGIHNRLYTKGKVYTFVDGTMMCDDGETWNKIRTFDEFNHKSSCQWLEVVED